MARRKLRLNLVAIALAIAAVVAFQVLTGTAPVTPAVAGGSGCEGDLGKIDGGDHTYEADGIGSVCVKAGNNVIVFQCGDAGDGCYTLDWTQGADGCCTAVTVGGGDMGRNCKAISHTAASSSDTCEPQPTPTPTPTPTSTPHP